MRSEYYPLVARIGWWFILPSIAAALYVGAAHGWVFSLPFWLLAGVTGFLFRDPERAIPAKPLGLVSPVDGRVLAIREAEDPYLERTARCLLLTVSRTGSYTVRSPMEGKLLKQWYAVPKGEKARARSLLASWIQSDEGDDIVLVVRPRLPWFRVRSHIGPGERVGQGMRFCYVPLGAWVELWMPADTHIEVKPGQRVRSGSDVVGTLNHGT